MEWSVAWKVQEKDEQGTLLTGGPSGPCGLSGPGWTNRVPEAGCLLYQWKIRRRGRNRGRYREEADCFSLPETDFITLGDGLGYCWKYVEKNIFVSFVGSIDNDFFHTCRFRGRRETGGPLDQW